MRRVVTGHAKDGKSIFLKDGDPTRVARLERLAGVEFTAFWATEGIPTIPIPGQDPAVLLSSFLPKPGETLFMAVRFPPMEDFKRAYKKGFDLETAWKEYVEKVPGLGNTHEKKDLGMHTTDTLDYGVVISGEIWLELDDGAEVHLKQGDVIVQAGTRHAWRNRGSEPCLMFFTMIGAKRL